MKHKQPELFGKLVEFGWLWEEPDEPLLEELEDGGEDWEEPAALVDSGLMLEDIPF